MKKILILFLLLVNLHVITDEGGIRLGIATISAQSMMQEQLNEVVIVSSHSYQNCFSCCQRVRTDSLDIHIQQYCRNRSVTCQQCHQIYYLSDGHICSGGTVDLGSRCAICGQPSSWCICNGVVATGNKNNAALMMVGGCIRIGYGGGGGGSGGGSGSSTKPLDSSPNDNSSDSNSISSRSTPSDTIKTAKSTKLTEDSLKNYKLFCGADTLVYIPFCQRDTMDCVSTQLSRTICIMDGDTTKVHMEAVRDSIEGIYTDIFSDKHLRENGVSPIFYHSFITLVADTFGLTATQIKASEIKDSIDNKCAIMLTISVKTQDGKGGLHQVQVTGYNNTGKTFSVSDPKFPTQNAYKIDDLTNPKYIEEKTIYSLKKKKK